MKREEDERRQKGGTVDFFFEVSTFMFRVLYGIVFSPSRYFFGKTREKILRYAIQKEHTLIYQDYSLDQHQRIVTTTFIEKTTMAVLSSHRKTTTSTTTTRETTFFLVPLLFYACFFCAFSSVSVEAAARFGRKLLQDVSLPSEDVLSGEEAMAMAPAPGPTPMTSTMEEEEEEEEEEPTILDEPTKRRRSLLQELGNGPVPSDDGILGEVVDGIEEVFAPAPAPTTMEEEEKEDLPPVRRKLLQVMGTPAMEEGMMPDMTGMMDPLPGTGMMDMGEAPSPAPAPAPADADIIDDEIIPPGRKLLQEEKEEPMPPVDESIALPPTESIIAEAPAPAPAPMEDIGLVEEMPGRKLLQEEEEEPTPPADESIALSPTESIIAEAPAEATAEAPSPAVVGTFEITTITGTITSDDYDPDGTGPN